MTKETNWDASYFKDRVDPTDDNFRLVEMRIPRDTSEKEPYGPFNYGGVAARERIRRFCAGFLCGMRDLTMREASRIIEKSRKADAKKS